jgi:hypothetical protein
MELLFIATKLKFTLTVEDTILSKISTKIIMLFILSALLLSACGQKGALYIPAPAQKNMSN